MYNLEVYILNFKKMFIYSEICQKPSYKETKRSTVLHPEIMSKSQKKKKCNEGNPLATFKKKFRY